MPENFEVARKREYAARLIAEKSRQQPPERLPQTKSESQRKRRHRHKHAARFSDSTAVDKKHRRSRKPKSKRMPALLWRGQRAEDERQRRISDVHGSVTGTLKCRDLTLPERGIRLSPEYLAYMDAPEWKAKRREAFKFHGRLCVKCGTTRRLHVHHKNYRNLFKENVKTDLEIQCRDCHEKTHGRKIGGHDGR